MKTTFQIYCDRGNGLELDGCWGSEHCQFATLPEANEAGSQLSIIYPDCAWVVCDGGKNELNRIPATV